MAQRTNLHNRLLGIRSLNGHAYFQPPEGFQMLYPCVVYEETKDDWRYADNKGYLKHKHYTLTLIDEDPDSMIREEISELFNVPVSREFIVDNLHHFVYNLYL